MLTKQAQDKLANLIDQGFIQKCAEHGLHWNNKEDQKVISDLMGYAYQKLQSGEIEV